MLGPPWSRSRAFSRRCANRTETCSRAQASAAYPENTLASFEAAIRDGAEGIESGESKST